MKKLLMIGTFLTVFVLGAASFAFFGDTLFSGNASASDPGGMMMEIAIEDEICDENGVCEISGGTVGIGFDEADGLPEISPDLVGLFVSRSDNSIMLGTGNIEVEVSVEQVNDQEPVTAVSAVHGGPEVELRISDETEIYFDTTELQEPDQDDFDLGHMTIQRTVEPGDLSSLEAKTTMVRAWGIMEEGVLVADVLVIEPIK